MEVQALLSEKTPAVQSTSEPPHVTSKERCLRQRKAQGTEETSGDAGLMVQQEGH